MTRKRLIYRGAEADVYRGDWCGGDAIYKVRKPFAYRLPQLDEAIRGRRTQREALMLRRAREAGVNSPHVYFVDTRNHVLVMEFVKGERMKERVSESPTRNHGSFSALGRAAARLHSAGIVHGDLTTSNVILGRGGTTLIDFGLAMQSSRLEDQAVDLRLAKETITGAHAPVSEEALESLFSGYQEVSGRAKTASVLRQLKQIERRGRYARVE